ncbi:GRX5 [Candida jiufengensis]|uniref:GRX5 n=1 Tax=Candida jiufengensis TaxID=497108 RepID=UPI00222574F8|nr:GRX5 [Candida jiufengensis]KAI5951389.1 GRX5 [Candida jiufengensis]
MFKRALFNTRLSSRLNLQQTRFISQEIKEAISTAINTTPVVLFMKGTPEFPQCGFSKATIQTLGQQGVDPQKFAAYNVLEDPELRDGIKEFSSWPTIPQLYVNGEFVGGCDIILSMAQNGELSEFLEKEGALIPENDEVIDVKVADVKPNRD